MDRNIVVPDRISLNQLREIEADIRAARELQSTCDDLYLFGGVSDYLDPDD